MDIDFLSSDRPLTKRFDLDPQGQIAKTPYPHVSKFTSHRVSVLNIQEFGRKLEKHAREGMCLLKGLVQRPLIQESRAGSTNSTAPTSLMVLDLDKAPFASPSDVLKDLGLPDVSYVMQYSSSQGFSDGLCGHMFIMLSSPLPAQFLKSWLMDCNLRSSTLRPAISLTRTGAALRWPLDVTSCQNDRLIYIAPPILGPKIKDPWPKRFHTHIGESPTLDTRIMVCPNMDLLQAEAAKHRAALRAAEGLPALRSKVSWIKGVEYQPKPGVAVVTGQRQDGDFIKLNINGGDSWGYFHPVNNVEFIHNFKGEPVYKTQELLPDYYTDYKTRQQAQSTSPQADGAVVLCFSEASTSMYWRGLWSPAEQALTLYPAKNLEQLDHWARQHGSVLPDPVPTIDMRFEPYNSTIVDLNAGFVNTYIPPERMRAESFPKSDIPPICKRVITHCVGEGAEYDHFINWLAFILQNNRKAGTAWILQGTQGTGKGILANKIVTPLFGAAYVQQRRAQELLSDHNGWLEKALIVFVDEMQDAISDRGEFLNANLKNYITEPMVSIRAMYRDARTMPSYASWIFNSNQQVPHAIESNDRRFNVGIYQAIPIDITQEEIDAIEGELDALCNFLMNYAVDKKQAHTVLKTETRDAMISNSRNSIEVIADALRTGDMDILIESMPDMRFLNSMGGFDAATIYAQGYSTLILRVLKDAAPVTRFSRDELHTIFEYCVGNVPKTPNKFTRYLNKHNIKLRKMRDGEQLIMGIDITWKAPATFPSLYEALNGGPTTLKAVK